MIHKARTKAMSWLLSLALMLSLVPGMSLTAYATTDTYTTLKNNVTVVQFNGYNWYIIEDNSTSATEGTVTLLAKDPIGKSKFHSTSNAYSGSEVKTYLDNLTGTGGSFASVADAIETVKVKGSDSDNEVDAKLWLLSTTEVNNLPTEVKNCSTSNVSYWWLRSPGTYVDPDTGVPSAACVSGRNGNVDGAGFAVWQELGVRPALKIDLSKVTFDSDTNTFSLKPTHTHSFTYTADGDTITATCNEDDCKLPDAKATLTIKPPANLVYDNKAKAATVEGTIPGVTTPDIMYKGRGGTNYSESTTAPTEIGDYTASVTLTNVKTGENQTGNVTASVNFTIKDTSYTITIPATLDVANAGWNATDGITASGEIAEDKKLTVTATSANSWALKDGDNTVEYHLATEAGGAATTVWEFSVTDLAGNGMTKPMGAVVEEYINKPAGEYTDTVTFTAEVEDAIKVVDLSTISGQYYDVTENVILTGTPNGDVFTIEYTNNYEVTLDNVNSAGNKAVFVEGSGKNMNIKLKGTSKLGTLGTTGTLTIDEAESGGTVILVYDYTVLSGSTVTINGGTVKARGTEGSPVYGSLTVNGGAVYLAGNADSYAVAGSITAGSGVTLYGWSGSAWTTDTNVQYVTTDNTSGDPTNWGW